MVILPSTGHPSDERVQRVALDREPDVFGRVGPARVLVEVPGAFDVWRTFAEDREWSRPEDRFTIGGHPRGQIAQNPALVLIDGAVAAQRNVQEQVSVLADDVHEVLMMVSADLYLCSSKVARR